MKNKRVTRPTRSGYTIFHQVVQHIPGGLIDKTAERVGVDARKFSCTSHVLALMYGHLSKASSLNEICDSLKLYESELSRIRGATAPKRSTFSHANRTRDPAIGRQLYWGLFKHLQHLSPSFTQCAKHKGFIHRFQREIYAADSTTLKLVLNSIDWARHRRKKAAAKLHMRLDVGTMLPSFAVVDKAAPHDITIAPVLCANLKDGNILLADRAYVGFKFMYDLTERGVFFVVRDKANMVYETLESFEHKNPKILSDEIVVPANEGSKEKYPESLRRVTAMVTVDGQEKEMVFLTNNFEWSPLSISELYRVRWSIEVFFKEIKQTLKLTDFVGYNENAVKWQVWIGLIVHLLLRFIKHVSKWGLSFSRLAGVMKTAIWTKFALGEVLSLYGTAGAPSRPKVTAEQLYFQGFTPLNKQAIGQHTT